MELVQDMTGVDSAAGVRAVRLRIPAKPEYIALYKKLERPEGAWLSLTDLLVARFEAPGHQTRH